MVRRILTRKPFVMNEILEKVKNDWAIDNDRGSWEKYTKWRASFNIPEEIMNEIAIRFAKAVSEKSLENAAKNADVSQTMTDIGRLILPVLITLKI